MDSLSSVVILRHLVFPKNLKVDFLLFVLLKVIWEWYFILHLSWLIRVHSHWVLWLNWLKRLCISWIWHMYWLLISCIRWIWRKNSIICMRSSRSLFAIFLYMRYMVQKCLVVNSHHQMISNLYDEVLAFYFYFVERMGNFHYNPVEDVN